MRPQKVFLSGLRPRHPPQALTPMTLAKTIIACCNCGACHPKVLKMITISHGPRAKSALMVWQWFCLSIR